MYNPGCIKKICHNVLGNHTHNHNHNTPTTTTTTTTTPTTTTTTPCNGLIEYASIVAGIFGDRWI
jgi:hypothetical protein